MEATVTLKLSPREFDLVRASLDSYKGSLEEVVKTGGTSAGRAETTPAERREAAGTVTLIEDLIRKVN